MRVVGLEIVGKDVYVTGGLAGRLLRAMGVRGVLGVFRLVTFRRSLGEGRLFRTAWLC